MADAPRVPDPADTDVSAGEICVNYDEWLRLQRLEFRAREWGACLQEALGTNHPTMEETVGAAIAAIHKARILSSESL